MTDGQVLDAETPPGIPEAPDPDRAPRWLRRLTVVVALVVAVGLVAVWLLGGFAERHDHGSAQPGEEVDAGNLVFVLNDATAQQDGTGRWTVTVNGTVRNDNDEALSPMTGDSGNLAVSRGHGTEAAVLRDTVLGGAWQRSVVPPGEPPVSLAATFRFPEGSTFGTTISVGVFAMEYSDNSILGVGGGTDLTWHHSGAVPTSVVVPLTILPPES